MRRLAWALVLFTACGGSEPAPPVIRLVDQFGSVQIENLSTAAVPIEPTEWRFDDPAAAAEWKAGQGVEGLATREARLRGRSTTEFPVLHLERKSGLDASDLLHEIVIRARISRGSNLQIAFRSSETVDLPQIVDRAKLFPWALTTPLIPGDELQTYRIGLSSTTVN
jgi:hypothetical protein